MVVVRPVELILWLVFVAFFLAPIVVGFVWIRADADRLGKPGLLWAVLTFPFGWLAVLVYVVTRDLGRQLP